MKTKPREKRDMSKKLEDFKTKRSPRKVHFELLSNVVIDSDDKTANPRQSNKFEQTHSKFANQTTKDEKQVHGTGNYVNGTLNFSSDYGMRIQMRLPNQMNASNIKNQTDPRPIIFRNQLTNDASAKCARKNCSIDQQYWDNAVNRRGILLHVSSENQSSNNIKFNKSKMRRYTSILMGPSNYTKRTKSRLLKSSNTQSPNVLELPANNQSDKKQNDHSHNSQNPFEKFSYKLISIKSATRKHTQSNSIQTQASKFDERAAAIERNACNNQMKLNNQCIGQNLSEILQLAHRWQSSAQSMSASDNVSTRESSSSVEFCTLKKLDVKM